MKDTNNLLTYNVWSGGEYNNDLTDLTNNDVTSISNKVAILGENSIQIGLNNTHWWSVAYFTAETNQDYTFTVNVYNPHGAAAIKLMQDSTVIATVSIPKSDEWESYQVSGTLTSTSGKLQILNYASGYYSFFDNLSVVKN